MDGDLTKVFMRIGRYELHPGVTEERVIAAVEASHRLLEGPGFCVACGVGAHGVKAAAGRYKCEACGKRAVYGAEQLLFFLSGF